jgi:hypothetical protein
MISITSYVPKTVSTFRSKPTSNLVVVIIVVVVLGAFAGCILAVNSIGNSGITSGLDNLFGDQHRKAAVALIVHHKVRYGEYPASLSDLRFTGQWDPIALRHVRYDPNPEGTAYYIEVNRAWIARPSFQMPDEFWRGAGCAKSLKPTDR